MKRPYFWSVCAVVALCVGAQAARAQPPAPGGARPPAFSPYLNLARPGSPAVLNYFGLVRPELQFRQAIDNIQQDVALNQQAIGGLAAGNLGLPVTGHATQFMNHGAFFMNNSGFLPALGGYGSGAAPGSGGLGVGGAAGSAPPGLSAGPFGTAPRRR